MSYNKDGLRHATHVFEAAAWHYTIKVVCSRCLHSVIFDAVGLWWWFQKRGREDNLRQARELFWCTQCAAQRRGRVRPKALELVREEPTRRLPMPGERDWKRALSRFRS